jgi:protein-arginine kinase activator protein McsA
MDCWSCIKNEGKLGFISKFWNPGREVEVEFKMYVCESCQVKLAKLFPINKITEEPYYEWVKRILDKYHTALSR